jgi:two-component system sensor histidine kinase KdpD
MNATEATSPPAERVLLCFDERPTAQTVIRRAAQLATDRRAELYALYVEPPGASTRRAPDVSDQLTRNRQLAHDLGAQVEIVCNHRVAASILAFAHEHGISIIVLGRSCRAGWRRLLGESVTRQIAEHSGAIAVQVVDL